MSMQFNNNLYSNNYDSYGARGPQYMMNNNGSFMPQGSFDIMNGQSIFQNVFGETDYDAVAGYGVANTLFGVLNQIVPDIIDFIHTKKNNKEA